MAGWLQAIGLFHGNGYSYGNGSPKFSLDIFNVYMKTNFVHKL